MTYQEVGLIGCGFHTICTLIWMCAPGSLLTEILAPSLHASPGLLFSQSSPTLLTVSSLKFILHPQPSNTLVPDQPQEDLGRLPHPGIVAISILSIELSSNSVSMNLLTCKGLGILS